MRSTPVAIAAGLFVAAASVGLFARQAVPRCDRVCLESWLDRYMDAFVAHAPSKVPLARAVKFTENGQRLEPGDGTWRTVTARGGYALKIVDVERGQAVLMGTIREADTPAIFILRLGVAGQQIAEIETLVIRNQMAAENLDRVARPRTAFAFAFFDNASGDTRNGTLADGRKVVSGPVVPWTWQIAEVFKVENGLIGPVESVLHQVPYGMGSGWSTWEESMSSAPRWSR